MGSFIQTFLGGRTDQSNIQTKQKKQSVERTKCLLSLVVPVATLSWHFLSHGVSTYLRVLTVTMFVDVGRGNLSVQIGRAHV